MIGAILVLLALDAPVAVAPPADPPRCEQPARDAETPEERVERLKAELRRAQLDVAAKRVNARQRRPR